VKVTDAYSTGRYRFSLDVVKSFILPAIADAPPAISTLRPSVAFMGDAPKRSVGETITQLVVIAILIAILIGTLIFLRQFIDSHNTSNSISYTPTSTLTCCGSLRHDDSLASRTTS
jgi:hypothetical protein